MGRENGGRRPNAGRKPKAIELERERRRYQLPEQAKVFRGVDSPMTFLFKVMLDPNAEWERRDAAARALLPYCHRRLADKAIGLKEQAQSDAETAGVDSEWGDDLTPPVKPN
jgi:hypothetical protein